MAFNKKQQDAYFHDGQCPYCGSQSMGGSVDLDSLTTKKLKVFCEKCEHEWLHVRFKDVGQSFLEDIEENEQERRRRISEGLRRYRDFKRDLGEGKCVCQYLKTSRTQRLKIPQCPGCGTYFGVPPGYASKAQWERDGYRVRQDAQPVKVFWRGQRTWQEGWLFGRGDVDPTDHRRRKGEEAAEAARIAEEIEHDAQQYEAATGFRRPR